MIIVGAGVAGAAFAYQQASSGRHGRGAVGEVPHAVGEAPHCLVAAEGAAACGGNVAVQRFHQRLREWPRASSRACLLIRPLRLQGCSGRRVLLLERDLSQPDRIVGELLQVGRLCRLLLKHAAAAAAGAATAASLVLTLQPRHVVCCCRQRLLGCCGPAAAAVGWCTHCCPTTCPCCPTARRLLAAEAAGIGALLRRHRRAEGEGHRAPGAVLLGCFRQPEG